MVACVQLLLKIFQDLKEALSRLATRHHSLIAGLRLCSRLSAVLHVETLGQHRGQHQLLMVMMLISGFLLQIRW